MFPNYEDRDDGQNVSPSGVSEPCATGTASDEFSAEPVTLTPTEISTSAGRVSLTPWLIDEMAGQVRHVPDGTNYGIMTCPECHPVRSHHHAVRREETAPRSNAVAP